MSCSQKRSSTKCLFFLILLSPLYFGLASAHSIPPPASLKGDIIAQQFWDLLFSEHPQYTGAHELFSTEPRVSRSYQIPDRNRSALEKVLATSEAKKIMAEGKRSQIEYFKKIEKQFEIDTQWPAKLQSSFNQLVSESTITEQIAYQRAKQAFPTVDKPETDGATRENFKQRYQRELYQADVSQDLKLQDFEKWRTQSIEQLDRVAETNLKKSVKFWSETGKHRHFSFHIDRATALKLGLIEQMGTAEMAAFSLTKDLREAKGGVLSTIDTKVPVYVEYFSRLDDDPKIFGYGSTHNGMDYFYNTNHHFSEASAMHEALGEYYSAIDTKNFLKAKAIGRISKPLKFSRDFSKMKKTIAEYLRVNRSLIIDQGRARFAEGVRFSFETRLHKDLQTYEALFRDLNYIAWEKTAQDPLYWQTRDALAEKVGKKPTSLGGFFDRISEMAKEGSIARRAGLNLKLSKELQNTAKELETTRAFEVYIDSKKSEFFSLAQLEDLADSAPVTLPSQRVGSTRVQSIAELTPTDGAIFIPTPDEHNLTSIKVVNSNGKLLVAEKDYHLVKVNSRNAYAAKLTDPTKDASVLIDATFSRHAQNKILIDPVLEDLAKIRNLSLKLKEAGFKPVANAIDLLVESSKVSRQPIHVSNLERLMAQKSIYTYQPAQGLISSGDEIAKNSFLKYSRFINHEGVLCAQCDTGNAIFTEFMNEYQQGKDGMHFRSAGGFQSFVPESDGGPRILALDQLHARTELSQNDALIGQFDATPKNLNELAKIEPIVESAVEVKPLARSGLSEERAMSKAKAFITKLEQNKKNMVEAFAPKPGIKFRPNEPASRATRLARNVRDWATGSLTIDSKVPTDAVEAFQYFEDEAKSISADLKKLHSSLQKGIPRGSSDRVAQFAFRYGDDSANFHLEALLNDIQKMNETLPLEAREIMMPKPIEAIDVQKPCQVNTQSFLKKLLGRFR